jgi:ribonuclease Z
VRRLVLTHFSQRYPEPDRFAEEAGEVFGGDVVVAVDLERVPVPRRVAVPADPPGAGACPIVDR